jgi:hypothetical protein
VQLHVLKATTEAEIDAAFAAVEQLQAGGLLVANDPFFFGRRAQLVALAAQHAVPAMYSDAGFIAAGGLISYGTNTDALFRQAGIYAGRILKGANPADLPVQQPTTLQAGGQSQNCEGAQPNHAAIDPRPRRRGHRINISRRVEGAGFSDPSGPAVKRRAPFCTESRIKKSGSDYPKPLNFIVKQPIFPCQLGS